MAGVSESPSAWPLLLGKPPSHQVAQTWALFGLLPPESLPLKIGASLGLLKEASTAPWLTEFLDNSNHRIIKSGTHRILGGV